MIIQIMIIVIMVIRNTQLWGEQRADSEALRQPGSPLSDNAKVIIIMIIIMIIMITIMIVSIITFITDTKKQRRCIWRQSRSRSPCWASRTMRWPFHIKHQPHHALLYIESKLVFTLNIFSSSSPGCSLRRPPCLSLQLWHGTVWQGKLVSLHGHGHGHSHEQYDKVKLVSLFIISFSYWWQGIKLVSLYFVYHFIFLKKICQSLSLSGGATLPAFDQDWPPAVWSFLLWARVRLQRLDTGEIYYGDHKVVVLLIRGFPNKFPPKFPKWKVDSPQVYQMTTNFEKFVEFNDVLQDWKRLRDERDAEQVFFFWSSHLFLPHKSHRQWL